MGRRSTTSALSRLISAVRPAGRSVLEPRNSCMTSLTMMAMVRPTRAIDRSWWRPAKASSSSRFTEVGHGPEGGRGLSRSEEHTYELPSLMRISYDVFCLKKKTTPTNEYQCIQRTTLTKDMYHNRN